MHSNTPPAYSNGRPLWQVILLYITTCGLYFFYWYYKASEFCYADQPQAVKPLWRTLGLLVPLLNIYLVWKLFDDLKKRTAQAGAQSFGDPVTLTVFFLLCSALYRLPNLYSFLGFLSVVPVALMQKKLNLYWLIKQPGLPLRNKLLWQEILICVLGSALLIMAVIGAGVPPQE